MAIDHLKAHLSSLDRGPVEDVDAVAHLLFSCWNVLAGSSETAMQPEKLFLGIEDVQWDPPVLRFCIERHGAFVQGSKRAAVDQWEINPEHGTATCRRGSYRYIRPMERPLDVKPIAQDIAKAVLQGADNQSVKWIDGSRFLLRTSIAVPVGGTAKQTVAGRRRRLRQELLQILRPHGWDCESGTTFVRQEILTAVNRAR